jgi:hypothetical protein
MKKEGGLKQSNPLADISVAMYSRPELFSKKGFLTGGRNGGFSEAARNRANYSTVQRSSVKLFY